ncbi:hypothetical protein QR77_18470, partial [Streptomyces sp. 150FB]
MIARLVAAQNAQDPAPLRGDEAVADAFALLREAAPSPESAIDLGSVTLVCWTFCLRHQGPEDPDAQRNMSIMVSTYGFLRLRLPADAQLPEPLRETFDPADPTHDARFAYLVSSVFGEAVFSVPDLGDAERLATLDLALAWSDTAHECLPENHEGFFELAVHTLGLNATRFQLAADPDALAVAARYAGAACERLSSIPLDSLGPGAPEAAAVALGTVLDAARLLGEPALAEVERLVAGAPDEALTPESAEALRFLRALEAEPFSWPGERDLRVGAIIADAGVSEHDAARIACGVRRLRAALADTPADHPAHPHVVAALGRALDAFARERGGEGAATEEVREEARESAREAAELLATVDIPGTMSSADEQLLTEFVAAAREFSELPPGVDPGRVREAGQSFGRMIEQLNERTARNGEPSPTADIRLQNFYITGSITDLGGVSDERIAAYRTALAAVPADQPYRYAYVTVLASLTGARAEALRSTEPAPAARLATAAQLALESASLIEEVAAEAPAGFLPVGLLRRGAFDAAVVLALEAANAGPADGTADLRAAAAGNPLFGELADVIEGLPDAADGELTRLGSLLIRIHDLNLDDPGQLPSDIEILREVLAEVGEEDPSMRASVAAALGAALSASGMAANNPAILDEAFNEAVPLLRYAREHQPEHDRTFDQTLAHALTFQAIGRFDAEAAREVSALLASSATEEAPTDINLELMSVHTGFFNALQNYVFGHEPGQLTHAREQAGRLKELTRQAAARSGKGALEADIMGDAMVDLVESVGPGGGPKSDITDGQIDRCRATFQACPAGHPMRLFTSSTLARVLTQHAVAVRGADPDQAARLLAEAGEVVGAVEAEAPGEWVEMLRTFIAMAEAGRLPPVSSSEQPEQSEQSEQLDGPWPFPSPPPSASGSASASPSEPDQPAGAAPWSPSNALGAMVTALRTRLSGSAGPGAWQDPRIPVWMRAHGELGAAAGALSRDQLDVDGALTHLEAAVDAMAEITDRGSDQQSAEHGLTTFEGDIRLIIELALVRILVREATVWARGVRDEMATAVREQRVPEAPRVPETILHVVTGPDVDRATELLERGRGLLLSRRLEARADLGGLRSEHPALAEEFELLTDQLTGEPDLPDPVPAGHAEWSRLARLRASRQLDALVERIRTEPGFDGFLRALSVEQLRALAAEGPIVVLNHSRRHCHALVVTAGSITALRLEAEADEITEMAGRLRDAVDGINAHGSSRPSPARLVAAGATVHETLSWTWHKIVRPVLELVGSCDPVPGASDPSDASDISDASDEGVWPRVWWVPTGSFNALPLHAAQCTLPDCELGGCGAALDAVVSSYVPGFQTLAYARTRAEDRDTADSRSALLVAAPEDELPGVAGAAAYAAEQLGAR